jgi:mono/diheme cytochrome c family protein
MASTFLKETSFSRADLKTFQFSIVFCSALLALSAVWAQTAPQDTGLISNSIYEKNCAKCHGKTAEGHHFGGPPLISEKAAAASADDLRNIITNGKGHMPKFAGKLSSEEIATLVKQIQTVNKK